MATVIEPVDFFIGIQLMAVQGPMARRVADLRLALAAMSRPSPRDPWHVPLPITGEPLPSPVRVALVVDPAGAGTSPQVAAGVRRAGEALAAAGYAVEEMEPPGVATAADTWLDLLGPELRMMWKAMSPLVTGDANRFMGMLLAARPELDPPGHLQTFAVRQALGRAWAELQQAHPLVVAPISTNPPFVVGADLDEEGFRTILDSMRMVVAVNLLGVPAVAVPAGVADGLPQAVQVIGPRFREDLCLTAAEAIEDACGVVTPIEPR